MGEPGCEVWIADLALRRPGHDGLLDASERTRADAFRRPGDRNRFVLGVALLKQAVAQRLQLPGTSVRVDRHCDNCGEPHGRPRVPGSGLHVSVAHSGWRVVVALTEAGPVGVDIEHRATGRPFPTPRGVLHRSEPLQGPEDLLTYWCRKESVVKATGEGLHVPLREVEVSAAGEAARLVSYRGKPLSAFLTDLEVGDTYAGALTVLCPAPVSVSLRPADGLLGG